MELVTPFESLTSRKKAPAKKYKKSQSVAALQAVIAVRFFICYFKLDNLNLNSPIRDQVRIWTTPIQIVQIRNWGDKCHMKDVTFIMLYALDRWVG
jgi:CRISPR/Cas system type I-B associated protein Csh2 (Cas7 group RAMP superfamily)